MSEPTVDDKQYITSKTYFLLYKKGLDLKPRMMYIRNERVVKIIERGEYKAYWGGGGSITLKIQDIKTKEESTHDIMGETIIAILCPCLELTFDPKDYE